MTDLQDQRPDATVEDATAEDAPAEDATAEDATAEDAPPPEGADHPDPYAHLGSNAPTGDEKE